MQRDVHESLIWFPERYSNRSGRLQRAVAEGRHIPEELLPGRMLMAMGSEFRKELAQTDWNNVAPWWIKVMCS